MTEPSANDAPVARPLITVIIPVYNDGAVAVDALRAVFLSAADGGLANIEVLCVEGGSTDDSADRIRDACLSEPRARLVSCPSGAVSPKFNLGAREAAGDWLAFTESDCVPDRG